MKTNHEDTKPVRDRPILFSAPMVRAILEGRKTQTRREVKPQAAVLTKEVAARGYDVTLPGDHSPVIACPHGVPGDRLWVKETGWEPPLITSRMRREGADTWPKYIYDADDGDDAEFCREHGWKRRPSIFMPRWASRITLEITGVRVERLNDISDADAIAEGIERLSHGWKDYRGANHQLGEPDISYLTLWEAINGANSWERNPWVWVIEFQRVKG